MFESNGQFMVVYFGICLVYNTRDFGLADATPEFERESISELMDFSGTDKLFRHAYDRYYERYFREFRDVHGIRILEIGADSGISLKVF